jgi:hypothetical protein
MAALLAHVAPVAAGFATVWDSRAQEPSGYQPIWTVASDELRRVAVRGRVHGCGPGCAGHRGVEEGLVEVSPVNLVVQRQRVAAVQVAAPC